MRIPIRLRLTLVFAAAMAVVLAGIGALVYARTGADLLAAVDMGLRSRAQVLSDAVGGSQEQNLIGARGALIDPDEAFAQVLDAGGAIVDASSAVRRAPLVSLSELSSNSATTFLTRRIPGFDDPVRLLAVPVDVSGRHAVVIVGATLGDLNDALDQLVGALITIGPAAMLITTVAGWLLAGAALRPVEMMRREAAAISASVPDRRLPIPATGDELARLASTLNEMLDRLQEALERERRFVDDASHELRTPLATLGGEIELALARPRQAPELEQALRSAQEDVVHLQRLAEDLLVLARARGGRIPVRRTATGLSDLVARSVRSVKEQARAAGVRIETEVRDASVDIDPDRMGQALRNLLENAIHATPRDGVVRIAAERNDGVARFVVADSGPGFPPELVEHAFDPFTRGRPDGDAPRGTGLGLAIVRAVVDTHGGSAWVENLGGGRVTIEIHA